MAKLELHLSKRPYVEVDYEPVSGRPSQWENLEIIPQIAEVPDELVRRYRENIGEFWKVQDELQRLYDEGVPANAVRPAK